jgi:sialate O-acetylesterase
MRALAPLVRITILSLLTVISITAKPPEKPLLSPVFGDHMVLQRDRPNTFWGWAATGEKVRITIGEHSATTHAAPDGRWETQLTPPPAQGSKPPRNASNVVTC